MKKTSRVNQHLEEIAQTVPGILWEADASTFRFTYVSPQSRNILGYTPEEWYESPTFWKDHIHPEDRDRAVKFCHRETSANRDHEFEYRMISADGEVVWLKDFVQIHASNGTAKLRGLMIDITAQKDAEQKRMRRLKCAYALATIGYWELNLVTETLYWSDEVKNLHEVGPDYIPDLETAIRFYKEGYDRDHISKIVQVAVDTGDSYTAELRIITAKGNERWVRVVGNTEKEDGRVAYLYGTTQDITEQKRQQQHIKLLSRVASETQNMVIITDPEQQIIWVNNAFTKASGYPLEEVIGRKPGEFLQGPDTDPETVRRMAVKLARNEAFSEELINYTKSGQPYWIKLDVSPILDESGKVKQFFAIQEDITERKKSQEQLKNQKERLEQSQKTAKIGDWELDIATGKITWSDTVFTIYQRDPKLGVPTLLELLDYISPEDRPQYDDILDRAIKEQKPYEEDLRIILDSGKEKYIKAIGRPELNGIGELVRIRGVLQDITDRKQAELELKEKKDRLSAITNNIEGMIHRYVRYPDGSDGITYISEGVEKLHEIPAKEAKRNPELLWSQIVDEDRVGVKISIDQSAQDLSHWDHTWRIRTPSGKLKWINGKGTPYRDPQGNIVWDILMQDVTDREQAIQERMELNRILDDSISEIYIMEIESLNILYANNVALNNLGYTLEELRELSPRQVNADYPNNELENAYAKINDGSTPLITFETRHRRADGSVYDAQVIMKKDTYRGREVLVASALNISEKKKIDQRLRSLLEIAPIPIYIESNEGLVIDLWNEAAERVIGFSKEEALNKKLPHISGIQWLEYEGLIKRLKGGEKIQGEEITRTRKDGSTFPARISASPLFDDDDNIESILVTMEDITEEKNLQHDLEEQILLAETILDSLPGLFYMMDAKMNLMRVNQNVLDYFNINEERVKDFNPLQLIKEAERPMIMDKIREVLKNGYAEIETKIVTKSGIEYDFYLNGRLLKMNGHRYIIGNGIDITERVRTQHHNEVLLQEVHHRVKNNLAIISGLLQLEMDDLKVESSRLPMQRSINRIQSIAKVHELLYHTPNFSTINIHKYIEELSRQMMVTLNKKKKPVIDLDIADVQMNVNVAIPVGMLMNELITNSLKYAFNEREGVITIKIRETDGKYRLRYHDDGPGFKMPVELPEAKTLGMKIIYTLLQQLDAEYEMQTEGVFSMSVTFEDKEKGSHSNL